MVAAMLAFMYLPTALEAALFLSYNYPTMRIKIFTMHMTEMAFLLYCEDEINDLHVALEHTKSDIHRVISKDVIARKFTLNLDCIVLNLVVENAPQNICAIFMQSLALQNSCTDAQSTVWSIGDPGKPSSLMLCQTSKFSMSVTAWKEGWRGGWLCNCGGGRWQRVIIDTQKRAGLAREQRQCKGIGNPGANDEMCHQRVQDREGDGEHLTPFFNVPRAKPKSLHRWNLNILLQAPILSHSHAPPAISAPQAIATLPANISLKIANLLWRDNLLNLSLTLAVRPNYYLAWPRMHTFDWDDLEMLKDYLWQTLWLLQVQVMFSVMFPYVSYFLGVHNYGWYTVMLDISPYSNFVGSWSEFGPLHCNLQKGPQARRSTLQGYRNANSNGNILDK
ncbi:hypothetical protein EDD18DRAFT_1098037 [Armillaria luteobubalina]|uniref:Uncharacterized protein n=1 Tax=Armillaria luteobubalina TaxID=153913 RepID=A0AA39QRZ5_9AGAR|nr:hypothetical protein EDD18DRAFT_1098037 [Armillaria luteobubalina]